MFLYPVSNVNAFSEQVIQHGATGEDVIELQARLQYIGFYHGTIDGVFGWGTYWALRHFQDEFGMPVDGLAGDQAKDMLVRATDYNKDFVRKNLEEGNTFTHYGGMPWEHQVKRHHSGRQQTPAPQQQQDQGEQQPAPEKQQDQAEQQPAPEQQPDQAEQQPAPEQQPDQAEQQPAPQQQPDQAEQQPAPEQQQDQAEQQPGPEQQEDQGEQQPAPEQQPEQEEQQPTPEQQPDQAEQQQDTDQADTIDDAPIEPTSVNIPDGYSQNDIQLMAQAVYGEARGEPYEGQVAVAAVILNRIQSPIFPNTVSNVIFEPRAFTAVADGQIYMEPNETARRAVIDAINGWDPSGEAIYYFNPDTATSSWIWSRPQIKRIGKHIFCD
ncbi:cell wall hydrolase [Natronobacillus azotifigens]|uniref:Spore cortex-lytic enzyme n=2 Tax=Natronobacillus azotifigens TaxID=472978 RepID=A0A9J6R999_9BACI|nr:cell wall hydrolase [Natronobacillus azotifigens]MCZ0701844.1 cell wall hydrolase [Natronobacillus azotifigens]